MSRETILKLLTSFAMMGLMFGVPEHQSYFDELTDEDIQRLKRIMASQKHKLMLAKGLQEFNIDGIWVLALNRKNAIRKANNIKKQLQNR